MIAAARNRHGVPQRAVLAMSESLLRQKLPPWWPQVDLRWDESVSRYV